MKTRAAGRRSGSLGRGRSGWWVHRWAAGRACRIPLQGGGGTGWQGRRGGVPSGGQQRWEVMDVLRWRAGSSLAATGSFVTSPL